MGQDSVPPPLLRHLLFQHLSVGPKPSRRVDLCEMELLGTRNKSSFTFEFLGTLRSTQLIVFGCFI